MLATDSNGKVRAAIVHDTAKILESDISGQDALIAGATSMLTTRVRPC